MFACAKLVAPNIFETLPNARSNSDMQERISRLDAAVEEARGSLFGSSKGELVEIPMTNIGLEHPVRALVRKLQ
jgi:hypothetical protein